ncbi:MAG: ABC transporter ATP-binding protein [Hyphomicrobiales bacterium]
MSAPFLCLSDVSKNYPVGQQRLGRRGKVVRAVDRVSVNMTKGETLGLVGESGCGKSSLARLIMRLEEPSSGTITLDGVNMATLGKAALKAQRRRFQMVFQDPYASLNPRMRVRASLAEALVNYRYGSKTDINARVDELAGQVGLSSYHLDRFPHELSGGQCQRVGLARAIALEPDLIVADEPVSALDVSIQAQILNLIMRLQKSMGLTLVFVSHDLSVVAHVADRVAVMYLGRIVETGPVHEVFQSPKHPYTQTLLAAIPKPTPERRGEKADVTGELPSPISPPSGCHFRTRCHFAQPRCAQDVPTLRWVNREQQVACHFAENLTPTNLTATQDMMAAARDD